MLGVSTVSCYRLYHTRDPESPSRVNQRPFRLDVMSHHALDGLGTVVLDFQSHVEL
jgi:hypothetical protein